MIVKENYTEQLELFNPQRWPKKPYCTDNLESGIYPRSLASAIKKKYIQANPPHLRIWSIYDLDYVGAATSWEDCGLPMPSWAAVNKANGHAHVVYGLSAPVLVDSPNMRQAPLRYLCAIEHAFMALLHADTGYSGLITKNPAHPLWRLLRGRTEHYDLSYLAEFVDLPKFIPKNCNVEEIGLGRNVMLFDDIRKYAYKHVREYRGGGIDGWNAWLSHMNLKALERNGEFKNPLQGNEVWQIAKSVSKWTYRSFDIEASDKRFSEHQACRAKLSGKARLLASEDKRATARLMRAKGDSYRYIASELDVSVGIIHKWCE